MYFSMKSYLKNIHNHTAKNALKNPYPVSVDVADPCPAGKAFSRPIPLCLLEANSSRARKRHDF
jgi:hypothetical protein